MKPPAISRAFAALILLSALARPASGAELREDFLELLRSYARGDRAQAIAGLAALSERDLEHQLQAVTALEHCRSCPQQAKLTSGLLRAAVMLHADTDRAVTPISNEVEQPRACPGRIAFIAGRYAALLALRPDAGDFPPRFFLYMVLRCQWDACLTDGLQWGREGVALFPRDPSLLFALGADLEEIAVLGAGDVTTVSVPLGAQQRAMMITRARDQKKLELYRESRRFYESALKLDPDRGLARLRLGVVSWRLHDMEAARAALQHVIERSHEAKSLFLAHLYLGRVHEDESRFDDAESEYRLALSLDPGAQSAAIALSHLLRLQGDGDASRQVLLTALSKAPRRENRDAYWDYLGGSDEHLDALLAALHREAEGE